MNFTLSILCTGCRAGAQGFDAWVSRSGVFYARVDIATLILKWNRPLIFNKNTKFYSQLFSCAVVGQVVCWVDGRDTNNAINSLAWMCQAKLQEIKKSVSSTWNLISLHPNLSVKKSPSSLWFVPLFLNHFVFEGC